MSLFNVGAFFVLFREGLEASIILGVLLRYLEKTVTNNPSVLKKLKRQVWLGAIIGLAISVILGIVFTVLFYVLKNDVLGSNMPLFEGTLQSVAVVLLTWLAFKMISVQDMYAKWEKKIQEAAQSAPALGSESLSSQDTTLTGSSSPDSLKSPEKTLPSLRDKQNLVILETSDYDSISSLKKTEQKSMHLDSPLQKPTSNDLKSCSTATKTPKNYGFMLLTFSVIIREGLESVIFIAGVGGGDPKSLIIPGLLGIVVGVAIGYCLYKGAGSLDLKVFFRVSTAILMVIAAGLACNAAWELEEWYFRHVINANVEGVGGEEDENEDFKEVGGFETIPERTPVLWDLSACCSENRNGFFQVLSTLIGWKAKPSIVSFTVYWSYWLIVGLLLFWKHLRSKRKSCSHAV